MSYYFGKTLSIAFDEALARTIDSLKKEGFGVLTEIDVRETLRKKIGVEFLTTEYLARAILRWPTKLSALRTRSAPCCRAMW